MIPISASLTEEYRAWLRQKHPTSVRHYVHWVTSLASFVGDSPTAREDDVAKWIEAQSKKSRRSARNGLRKYILWAKGMGFVRAGAGILEVPRSLSPIPEEKLAKVAEKRSGPLNHRQMYALVMLYHAVPLPVSAVGKLRFEHLALSGDSPAVIWAGKTHPLPQNALKIVQDWIRIRERLKALPEERRRHRKTDEWAESPYLFPNPRGGASGYHAIWRLRRGSTLQNTSDAKDDGAGTPGDE